MTPQQLAELLVGIAKAQAAVLSAVERTFDKSTPSAVRQAAQQGLHGMLTHGTQRHPITFENLPAKLLEGALAPGSLAGRELGQTALSEVTRILGTSENG